MTWLIPLVFSILITALIASWVHAVVPHPTSDPMGALIATTAYVIGFLICVIAWLLWLVLT